MTRNEKILLVVCAAGYATCVWLMMWQIANAR